MRALVCNPKRVPGPLYRRFVQQVQVRGLFPDGLVRGEPYLALNAIVLRRSDVELLQELTGVFSRAFHRAGRHLAGNVPALVELAFPWMAAELLAGEEPRVPLVGRFDFVCDEQGHWWLLEFNADTPSGVREAIVADALVWRLLPEARLLGRTDRWLAAAMKGAFRSALRGMPPGEALGLVTTASELEDLAQMAFTQRLLRPALSRLGTDIVLGDVHNLRRTDSGLELLGRKVAALYRYLPFEFLLGTPAFTAICDAGLSGDVRVLNGLYGLLLQNKGLMAWLWEHRDSSIFRSDEQSAITRHLAPTWMFADAPAGLAQADLVAKQVFGREGEEIFFGEALPPADWQRLRGLRTYVVQRRVDVAAIQAAVPTSLGQEVVSGRASVGCFAVAGTWAGFYSRLGGKIITSQAKWVATYMEPVEGRRPE